MTSQHSRFGQRLIPMVVVMLVPLLAACGGSAGGPVQSGGVSPSGSGAGIAPAAAAAATSAPAAMAASAGPAAPPVPAMDTASNAAQSAQQQPALKAGEIDDNAEFAAYEDYLSRYRSSDVHAVDVSERYILTVSDSQQRPVIGATVRVFVGEQPVFNAQTTAGGKVIFFPRAIGVAEDASELRMEATKGNQQVTGTLKRGQDLNQELTLPGETAASTPKLDVLFLIDATGSMGDEIYQVQRAIRSIADQVDALEPRPDLRFGLVAYRDQGEEYITRAYDFTPDVAAFRETLSGVRADGGGDNPEALTEGLHAAVDDVGWADGAIRLTFLVADAPPHVADQEQRSYVDEIRNAAANGIKIYPIAASNSNRPAEYVFRQMAQQTLGRFIFLTYESGQNAGAPGDTTTMNVDPGAFTPDRLDDIVVNAIKRELTEAAGAA